METRKCITCGIEKQICEFATYKTKKTKQIRYLNKCLSCMSEYRRKAAIKHNRKIGRKEFKPIEQRSEKHCRMCGRDYPRTAEYFYRNKASKDGLMYQCKECSKKYAIENKPYDKKLQAIRTKKWRQTEKGKRWHIMSLAKSRAMKRENGPCERIYRDIVWRRDSGICHICGESCQMNSWHLDHIIPLSRGGTHTYDNVAVSHPICNIRKKDKLPNSCEAKRG